VTFNEKMNPATITQATFSIMGDSKIAGTLTYDGTGPTFTFTPSVPLKPNTTYTGRVSASVKNLTGNSLQADYVWTFTTALPELTLTLSSNPVAGGLTSGGGTFASGTSVTAAAVPSSGFAFVNWTEGATVVSTNALYTFNLNASRTLVANFTVTVRLFVLTVNATNGTVAKNPDEAAYIGGSSVLVTATANPGYTFVSWSGDATGSVNPLTVVMNSDKNITAHFILTVTTFTLSLSSNPLAGGTTTGAGTYNSGTQVTAAANPNNGFTFTNWTEGANVVSTNAVYEFTITGNRTLVANFTENVSTFTLNVTAINGSVEKNPDLQNYNSGSFVELTAIPVQGYTFTSWSVDATGSQNPLIVVMNSNKNITANFTREPIGPGVVDLGTAGDFTILTKTGISTTGITLITGDIGVSPAAATYITGFGLIMDINNQSSHTPLVIGKVYAADYAAPTPAKMTTAVSDMETAFTTANNLVMPAPIVDLYAGDISGRNLHAGLYKWSTGLLITGAGVTLSGGPDDTWVFQIAQDFTVGNGAIVTLAGGAQAKNIFWVVTGKATLGSDVDFSGNILSKTLISLNTGAKVTGRLLAQTAVTLNASTVILP
jgi:uncharacterized repeat protein (TIGR02543 family)